MLGLTYLAEILGELTLLAGFGQVWALPFLIYLNVADTANTSRWVIYAVTTLLLGYPNGKISLTPNISPSPLHQPASQAKVTNRRP